MVECLWEVSVGTLERVIDLRGIYDRKGGSDFIRVYCRSSTCDGIMSRRTDSRNIGDRMAVAAAFEDGRGGRGGESGTMKMISPEN